MIAERGGVRRYLDTVKPEEYRPNIGEVNLRELSLTGLADLYGSDKGKIKHCYTEVYERLIANLSPNRQAELSIGEIGVACGASLRMWANYLPNAKIEGFDIRPECATLCQDLENVTISIVDPRNTHRQGQYDLLIDDGSHISEDIVTTVVHCQNWVKSGGFYVIEDLGCTYNPEYTAKFNQHFGQTKKNDRKLMLQLFDELSRLVDSKTGTFTEMHYYPQLWVLKKR